MTLRQAEINDWRKLWADGFKYAVYRTTEGLKPLPLQPPQTCPGRCVREYRTLGEAWIAAYGYLPTFRYNMRDEEYNREVDEPKAEETL